MDFEIVSDSRRMTRDKYGVSTALKEGQTVYIPGRVGGGGGWSQEMKRVGLRLRTHQESDGLVMWAEKHDG